MACQGAIVIIATLVVIIPTTTGRPKFLLVETKDDKTSAGDDYGIKINLNSGKLPKKIKIKSGGITKTLTDDDLGPGGLDDGGSASPEDKGGDGSDGDSGAPGDEGGDGGDGIKINVKSGGTTKTLTDDDLGLGGQVDGGLGAPGDTGGAPVEASPIVMKTPAVVETTATVETH